jgi:light-regulated signal transduction histidine kinase (bacteriophytochrome)
MSTLITDLLNYSRIGKDTTLSQIDCNILLQEILKDMTTIIEESGAAINSEKLPVIKGYTYLKSLFQNLIINAIKFRKSDTRPIINISVQDKNTEWLFAIKDNGIGIEKEYHNRIFLIFQRLHTRAEYQGTGIGLAHCKKIIELHGGKLWLESELGKGSTFYFTIPKTIMS